jgi:hypothetical protein
MIKQLYFVGQSDQGVFAQGLFGSAGAFEKTAGAPPFSDWETGDKLREAIGGITAADRKRYAYVLVNALGAGEYYGSNINADWFPWASLAHEGDDYGYRTFLKAHAFLHHRNKPHKGHTIYGDVIFSILNNSMKRVEIIVRLDREVCMAQGGQQVLARIDAGEFPDVSMGCKVPWDECSVCKNHSKDKDDYCVHMKPPEELRHLYGPNRILPDGRIICVHNIYPRFFDISFVFIGADKTAKVMMKLAFDQRSRLWLPEDVILSADAGYRFYHDLGHEKTASALPPCPDRSCVECDHNCGGMAKLGRAFGKTAAHSKVADIIKDIPAGSFGAHKLPELEQSEPTFSREDLNELAEHPLPHVLGASSVMGMILKPQEFQHLVLERMGETELLEQLERSNEVFPPSKEFTQVDINFGPEDDEYQQLYTLLCKYVPHRGCYGAPFTVRVHLKRNEMKVPLPRVTAISHPLLCKLSAAYNGYRRNVLTKLSEATEVLQRDPRLREQVLEEGIGTMMKTSSSSPLLSLDSVVYMMGAYLEDRQLLHTTAVAAVNTNWLS